MTPKVQGLASAIAKLRHGLDDRADKLLKRVEDVGQRGNAAFDKAHAKLDESERALGEVDSLVAELDRTNGGPTLDDSSSATANEPQGSWSNQK